MKAEELRKITEQSKLKSANKFWEEFKETLFEGLKCQAEGRQDSITIRYNDDLAETSLGACWITCDYLRKRVQQELEGLGYEFYYNDDRQGDYVTIGW